MEQLNVMTTKDNERMFKILTDLLHQDKEFQIMITVPSASKEGKLLVSEGTGEPKKERDLEKDVTDMIHEIGVPAQVMLISPVINE